ncbi:hypothetical protein ABW21_db0204000 [Orbilia brochopaga]|nr:hypothetical protein ABW21_db0204000 [Drechslerella brochopaga]
MPVFDMSYTGNMGHPFFFFSSPLSLFHARIHSLCDQKAYACFRSTILFKVGNVKYLVRCCRDVAITPSISELRRTRSDFDQEVNVSEERTFTPVKDGHLKLTASLSRPYWFSGGSAFVDVVIENGSLYHIGKLRIKLVRHIAVYKDSKRLDGEPGSSEPTFTLKKTMARSELNTGSRWTGLKMDKQASVTCEIEIPKGQLTIPLGTWFSDLIFSFDFLIGAKTNTR